MGKVNYDSLSGLLRVLNAKEELDPFVLHVVTYHAALEYEMDEFLKLSLHRADKLRSGGLGFKQKIALVNATWRGDENSGDVLATALIRFNDLRNAVAHNDSKKEVRRCMANLAEAVEELETGLTTSDALRDMAMSICAFMGDDAVIREEVVERFNRVSGKRA